jgi:hypothetical protein
MVITMVAITGLFLREAVFRDGLLGESFSPNLAAILDFSWWITLLAVVLTFFSGADYLSSYIGLSDRLRDYAPKA